MRLIKEFGEALPADAAALLNGMLPAAATPDQQKAIAGAFAQIHSLRSPQASVALVDTPELVNEAAAFVLQVAEKIAASQPSEVRAALSRLVASGASAQLKKEADELRLKIGEAGKPAQ